MITPDRLEAWRRTAATTPGRTARALLDACNEIESLQAERIDPTLYRNEVTRLLADRDRAREVAVALEQQLAEIKRLAYMGGQNGEVVRGWIIGVFERANTLDPQGQQDIHVCSPQTCGAVYNQEEDE